MPKPKMTDPKLVRLPQGRGYITMAADYYGYATGDVCEALRCSRSFVDAHIKPYISHIYVSGKQAVLAWPRTETRAYRGGLIYSNAELAQLLESSVIERRTRVVWPSTMLSGAAADQYCELLEVAAQELREISESANDAALSQDEVSKLRRKYARLESEAQAEIWALLHESAQPGWQHALAHLTPETKRGKAEWYEVGDASPSNWEDFRVAGWESIETLTDWGETREMTYRRIWREGMQRLTLAFPDGGTRQLYRADPCPEKAISADEGLVAHPYVIPIGALPGHYLDKLAY